MTSQNLEKQRQLLEDAQCLFDQVKEALRANGEKDMTKHDTYRRAQRLADHHRLRLEEIEACRKNPFITSFSTRRRQTTVEEEDVSDDQGSSETGSHEEVTVQQETSEADTSGLGPKPEMISTPAPKPEPQKLSLGVRAIGKVKFVPEKGFTFLTVLGYYNESEHFLEVDEGDFADVFLHVSAFDGYVDPQDLPAGKKISFRTVHGNNGGNVAASQACVYEGEILPSDHCGASTAMAEALRGAGVTPGMTQ